MTLTEFLFYSLAVWRLSSLLTHEEGPYELFQKLRYKIGVRWDEYSNPYGESTWAKGILCMWCNSMWGALVLSTYQAICSKASIVEVFVWALAMSSVAIFFEENLVRK